MSSLYADAQYKFGPTDLKFIPLNQSLKTSLPIGFGAQSTLVSDGGVGPFDYSGASSSVAVPLTIKIQGVAETKTIDVATGTGSVDESAVTAAELATAITTAAFTGITASAATGRIAITVTTPGTDVYLQVYGEAAIIALFGQGYGQQFRPITTQESFPITPKIKDSETIEQQTTQGKIISIETDSYRFGFTSEMVLTNADTDLRAMIEGGIASDDGTEYDTPTSDSTKAYFAIESVQAVYARGVNLEQSVIGYILNRFYIANATYGEEGGGRDWQKSSYSISGNEYKDPDTLAITSDQSYKFYTPAQWDALGWASI